MKFNKNTVFLEIIPPQERKLAIFLRGDYSKMIYSIFQKKFRMYYNKIGLNF